MPRDDMKVAFLTSARAGPSRWAWPAGVAVAAAAVFGATLGRLPLWRDEAASVAVAARPVPAILVSGGHIDAVHTAYYLLLHPLLAAGEGEAWVRLPSLLGAVAAVTLMAELARRRLGAGPAVVTAALLLGNPWLAFYAREARPFALAAALVCGAAFALLSGPPTPRRWVTFTLLGMAATGLHLFVVLPLLALATSHVLLALRPRPSEAAWGLSAVATLLAAAAPLAVLAAEQRVQLSWLGPPTGDDVRRLAVDAAGTPVAAWTLAALALITAGAVAVRWAGGASCAAAPAGAASDGARLLGVALAGALAGPAVLLGVSAAGLPVYVERYVLPTAPLLALAAGALLTRFARLLGTPHAARHVRSGDGARRVGRTVAVAVAVLVAVAGLSGVPATAAGPPDKGEDLRAGAAAVAAGYRPGDCVAYRPGWARVGFEHYLDATPARPRDVALDPDAPLVGLFPVELPQARVEAALRTCPRIWVVGYPGRAGAWRPVPEVTGPALAAVAPAFTAGPTTVQGELAETLLVRA